MTDWQHSLINSISFKPLTYQTKTKLGYCCITRNYHFGQKVLEEGETGNKLFLIQKGEFEVTKDLYLIKDPIDNTITVQFKRLCSSKPKEFLNKLFNTRTQILYTDEILPRNSLKPRHKEVKKQTIRIAIRGEGDQVGLRECIFGCPYSTISVKCVSKEGSILIIDSKNFINKVKESNPKVIQTLVKRLNLIEHSISNYSKVK